MQNFENLILENLRGNTPKEKYQNMITDERELSKIKAKISQAETFLQGLQSSADSVNLGSIRSFINANAESLKS